MHFWNFLTASAPEAAQAATEGTEAAAKLGFEPGNFIENLQHMGVGMLVIFVVIGIIILTTLLNNKVFSD